MEKLVNTISAKICALETEGKNNTDLETRIKETVRSYQRDKMIDEINFALNLLAINVNRRPRQLEFFL